MPCDEQSIRKDERDRIFRWLTDRAHSLFGRAAKLAETNPESVYPTEWRNMAFCLVLAATDIQEGAPPTPRTIITTSDLSPEELEGILRANGLGPVVHILLGGHSLCNKMTSPPSSWPDGHKWVGVDTLDRSRVTCSACKQIIKYVEHLREQDSAR
jgi:hypothetical protein